MSIEEDPPDERAVLEGQFRSLFSREPSEAERNRLLAMGGLRGSEEWEAGTAHETALSPLSRCLEARRRRRTISWGALAGLAVLVGVLWAVASRNPNHDLLSLLLRSVLAGLVLAAAHQVAERWLNAREREAVRIAELARSAVPEWVDSYGRWLEGADADDKSKWLAAPWALLFVVALLAGERAYLPEAARFATSVTAIVAAYLCLSMLIASRPRRSAST